MNLTWHPNPVSCPKCGDSTISYEVTVNDHHYRFPVWIFWCMDCCELVGVVKPKWETWKEWLKEYLKINPEKPQHHAIYVRPEPEIYTLFLSDSIFREEEEKV
jgi:hypothetical protein